MAQIFLAKISKNRSLFTLLLISYIGVAQTVNVGDLYISPGTIMSTVGAMDNKSTGNLFNDGDFYVYSHYNNDGLVSFSSGSTTGITRMRGMFGYQDMIVDFRGIPTMQQYASTVLDVTHSLQQPNQTAGVTGGRPDMIETIAKAGIAVGVDGIFIETHFDPANAKSDGANMLHLDYFEALMTKLVAIRKTVNQF